MAAQQAATPQGGDQQIIQRLLEQRQRWVPMPGCDAEVLVQRPAEAELQPYLVDAGDGKRGLRAELPQVKCCVVGWRRVTEAILLGPTVGGDEEVPFTPAVWAVAVADRHDWVAAVADAVLGLIVQHYQGQADARGN